MPEDGARPRLVAGPATRTVRRAPDAGERTLDPTALGDHLDRLYRAARALCGSREDADDLVQETYARVLTRPRLLRDDDDLGYLLRALRNTYVTTLRTRRRRPRTAALPHDLDPVDPRAHDEAQEAAEAGDVLAAVGSLPAPYRDAIVAVDLLGLSYPQACHALRVRGGTVKSRLYRARRALLPLLADPSAAPAAARRSGARA